MMAFEDLDERLDEAPEDVLRQVLRMLCHQDHYIKEKTSEYLEKFNEAMVPPKATEEREVVGSKRNAADSEVKMCVNCETVFTEAHNTDASCTYHTGELYFDDRDWQIDLYEGDDTPEPEDCPESHWWNCCEARYDSEKGCVTTKHIAVDAKRQKICFQSSPSRREASARANKDEDDMGVKSSDPVLCQRDYTTFCQISYTPSKLYTTC